MEIQFYAEFCSFIIVMVVLIMQHVHDLKLTENWCLTSKLGGSRLSCWWVNSLSLHSPSLLGCLRLLYSLLCDRLAASFWCIQPTRSPNVLLPSTRWAVLKIDGWIFTFSVHDKTRNNYRLRRTQRPVNLNWMSACKRQRQTNAGFFFSQDAL